MANYWEAPNTVPVDPYDFMRVGDAKLDSGDIKGAIKAYTKSIEVDPGWPAAWVNRGSLRLKDGDYEGAIADCSEALKMQKEVIKAWWTRGAARLKICDLEGAISDSEEALRRNPNLSVAWSTLGSAKYLQQRLDEAIADCSRAIELNEHDERSLSIRAAVRLQEGRFKEAYADCCDAILVDPLFVQAWTTRGNVQLCAGVLHDAIEDCNEALRLDPSCAAALCTRGTARMRLDQIDEGFEDCKRAVELDPTLGLALSQLGMAKLTRDLVEEAIEDCDRAIKSFQDQFSGGRKMTALVERDLACVLATRGQAKLKHGEVEESLKDFTESLKLESSSASVWRSRGGAKLEKYPEGAISDCNEALRLFPRDAISLSIRGAAQLKLDNLQEALTDSCDAININPDLSLPWKTLGICILDIAGGTPKEVITACSYAIQILMDAGSADIQSTVSTESRSSRLAAAFATRGGAKLDLRDFPGTIEDCSQAIQLDPSQHAAWLNRAGARLGMFDTDGAVSDCNEAVNLQPHDPMTLCHRALSLFRQGEYDAAIADCSECLKHERRISNVWAIRGGSRLHKGDFDGALEDCNVALELNPGSAWAIGWRGSAHAGKENFIDAVRDCGQVLKLEPPTTQQYIWTWTHTRLNSLYKKDEVVSELKAAMVGDPQFDLSTQADILAKLIKLADGMVSEDLIQAANAKLAKWREVLVEVVKFDNRDDAETKVAVARLIEMGDAKAVPYLMAALNTQTNPFVRHVVCEALGRLGEKIAIPALERVVKNATKSRDKETLELANVAMLEIKKNTAAFEELLNNKRIKPFHKAAVEKALARLRKSEEEEREREARLQAELLPS